MGQVEHGLEEDDGATSRRKGVPSTSRGSRGVFETPKRKAKNPGEGYGTNSGQADRTMTSEKTPAVAIESWSADAHATRHG